MIIKNLGGHLCTEAAQSTLGYPTETVEKNLLLGYVFLGVNFSFEASVHRSGSEYVRLPNRSG